MKSGKHWPVQKPVITSPLLFAENYYHAPLVSFPQYSYSYLSVLPQYSEIFSTMISPLPPSPAPAKAEQGEKI